jgi:hypothetical protein
LTLGGGRGPKDYGHWGVANPFFFKKKKQNKTKQNFKFFFALGGGSYAILRWPATSSIFFQVFFIDFSLILFLFKFILK